MAPRKTKIEVVKEEFWSGRQSSNAERVVKFGPHKIRALVCHDAYDFQSYARVSVWTAENGWKLLTHIPYEKTAMKTTYRVGLTWQKVLALDLDALVGHAVAILA